MQIGRSKRQVPNGTAYGPSWRGILCLLSVAFCLGKRKPTGYFPCLLRNWGGLRTYEIAEHVGLSKPTVSHHLSIMKKAGIVSVERIGTVRIYHPNENTKPWKILSQLAWKAYRFVEEEASKETCQRMLTFGKERNIDGPDASN